MESLRPAGRAVRPQPPVQVIALLFSSASDTAPWWERLLARDYGHVDVLVISPGHAVLLESFGSMLAVTDLEKHTALRLVDRWDGPVVQSTANWRRDFSLPLGVTSCVALAKALLGCDRWSVQTPWQLCCWVLAHGGWTNERTRP